MVILIARASFYLTLTVCLFKTVSVQIKNKRKRNKMSEEVQNQELDPATQAAAEALLNDAIASQAGVEARMNYEGTEGADWTKAREVASDRLRQMADDMQRHHDRGAEAELASY